MHLLYDILLKIWENVQRENSVLEEGLSGLSEEGVILEIPGKKATGQDRKSESSDGSSAGKPQSASNVLSREICDEVQMKNANHELNKTLSDVSNNNKLACVSAKKVGSQHDTNTTQDGKLKLGANQDTIADKYTRLPQLTVQNEVSEQKRRSSYAGVGVKQEQSINVTASLKDGMLPRPHSSCEMTSIDKTEDKSSSKSCSIFDMKRQFSNSSSTGSHNGIDISIGAESDSDDDDVEIKLPDLPEAKFSHRSVSIKASTYKHFYDLKDPIGGGRFGRVYHCTEKKTGLQLAAKCFLCKKSVSKNLLKSKSLKVAQNLKTKRTQQEPVEREDVMMEVAIMNQIDHQNIVKLYDAYEHDNTMTLILEYLDGGELFERVLANQAELTELDAVLFMKQIVTAVQYLHKNLVLHLDLKPENILCLDRSTHHIKIIDFGLARKYIPRQKLIVQWGTPEFMAPEILNYEVVSFPSDMWSVGVICYILLSGLSPFLGEDDSETLENIVECAWDFDDDCFNSVSDEAKEFISRLLVEEKSGRMSASQCLKHEWLATPLTSKRRKALMNKNQLKNFMARMQWKASIAAVSAANWLKQKVNSVAENVTRSCDTAV